MSVEERPARQTWGGRIAAAVLVLILLLASALYGVLIYTRHLFPYRVLRHARQALHPMHATHHEHHAKTAAADSPSVDAIQHLANLPYLDGYRPATGGGVIRTYDRTRAEDGLNFFTSGHAPVATLMDMDGRIVKTWTADAQKAIPGIRIDRKHPGHERFLRDAELLPDGGIVAMFDELGLVRLDASSRVLWAWRGAVHHDLFVDSQEHIWSIAHDRRVVAALGRDRPVWDDALVELSSDGQLLRKISIADCFARSRYAAMLMKVPTQTEDVFHTNSVAVLDGRSASELAAFRRGNLLVSIKRLNAMAVIDPEAEQVVWALTGQWYGQHSVQLSPAGHALLFDNLGTMRLASRVLEVDPITQKVLWSFGGGPGEDLLSETVGFVDRLRNGNTLITESNHGRVLEVTPENRVVWEFANPNRVGRHKDLVAVVYFMERVARDLPFLRNGGAAPGPAEAPSPARPS